MLRISMLSICRLSCLLLACWGFLICGLLARGADRLQGFLDVSAGYQALPAVQYTPKFSLRAVEEPVYAEKYFWILDGAQKIGLLNLDIQEIEMFRSAPPADGRPVDYRMPAVHHWATLQGPRIMLKAPDCVPNATGKITYLQQTGPTLEFRYDETNKGGTISGGTHFLLRWDAKLGYAWHCQADYTLRDARKFEYNNMLGGGLSESRDTHKRWQRTIWARPDGTVAYMFQNPLSPLLPDTPEWRDVAQGGFVGFVTDKEVNPFLIIDSSSSTTCMSTCTQWYDQHIFARPPAEKEADGQYHVRATFRFLSLPGNIAAEVDARATAGAPYPGGPRLGLRAGVVNDFETFIQPGVVYNGAMWVGDPDTKYAHSGTHSLKVTGEGPGRVARQTPAGGGSAIYGESAKRYRLSAWVKTEGLQGGRAYLKADDVFFTFADVRATRQTPTIGGDTDWTLLSVDFQPSKNDPFLVINLCVEGTGSAWFDDLALMEIPEK